MIQFETYFKKGGTNDCSTCKGGSSGTCYADAFDCPGLGYSTWKALCGKTYVEAGAEGCSTCANLREPTMCPTTCNWCTDMSKTSTTSTTSTTTTTTTTTENTRRNNKFRISNSLNIMTSNTQDIFVPIILA